jgi:regulator of sigma E protease
MSKPKGQLRRNFRLFLLLAVVAGVIYLIVQNLSAFGNVLLVVIGFGAMILVHELGHFSVAKLSGIKVDAFSLGFPPTLVGVLRTEKGYRVRVLPGFFRTEEGDKSDGSLLTFTIGKRTQAGETEYRIGLIPFGGYNKILGQEDVKAAETSNDPRSFANKPVSVRMAVIAAGVFFNAVSAVLIFMVIFLVGIKLMPPIVGGVIPDSPAARAGLKPGDAIVEIGGKRANLDFSNIGIAAALAGRNEPVGLKVRCAESLKERELAIVPKQLSGRQVRAFGILPPLTLTVAKLSEADAEELRARTGLLPGDRVISVNGRDVDTHWELDEIVQNVHTAWVDISAQRIDPVSKEAVTVESQIGMNFNVGEENAESEAELSHIYSMVPRIRIAAVERVPENNKRTSLPGKIEKKLLGLFGKAGSAREPADNGGGLRKGDIILAIGEVENPTYEEMRKVTTEYEGNELPVKVLRRSDESVEESVAVSVVPKRPPGGDAVMIGVGVVLDMEHAVVAETIAVEDGPAKLEIPGGASITAVDGKAVSNFYDIIREIRRCDGKRIPIDWRIDEQAAGGVALNVDNSKDFISIESAFAESIPFEPLQRLYRASGPVDAVVIGCRKTVTIIVQTYVSLKLLVSGLVGQQELSGPVGIVAITYKIAAQRPLIEYIHFFGVISVLLAVFNLLPIPPVDGGWLVLLLVEKVKGSALSERAQEVVAYAGIMFILGLFIYLTFNDILNMFFR